MAELYNVCQILIRALLTVGEAAQEPLFEDSAFFRFIQSVAYLIPSTILRGNVLQFVYNLTEMPFIILLFGVGISLIISIKVIRFIVSIIFG